MTARRAKVIAGRWLRKAQFCETHAVAIDGRPDDILDAVEALKVEDDVIVRRLLQIREAPSRIWGRLGGRSGLTGRAPFGLHEFCRLERADNCLAYGLVGRFWRLDFGLEHLDSADAFLAFDRPGVPKLVMLYAVERDDDGTQMLVTHTAVSCPDRISHLMFLPYWLAIRLASGFIRNRILAVVERKTGAMLPSSSPS
ncbi:hypothetical protein [Aliiroseovarius crassostreae]|uniref:hypothetical protein n=1 Tax=Aliiroseovarius crassostreae TaxID=154981 RepID=UPI003C7C5A54